MPEGFEPFKPDNRGELSRQEMEEAMSTTARSLMDCLDDSQPAMAGICSLALFELMTYHACPPSSFQINWTAQGKVGDLFSDVPIEKDSKWKCAHAQQMLEAKLDLSVNWFVSSRVPSKAVDVAGSACALALEGVEKSIEIWLHGTPDEPETPTLKKELVAGYARLYFSWATQVRYWSVLFRKEHQVRDTSDYFKHSMCNSPVIQRVVEHEEHLQEFFDFNMSDAAWGSD